MKILLTGASGFLGKYILDELQSDTIVTIGRNNATIICDLSKEVPHLAGIELVIHAAGKAHLVPKTKKESDEFFSTNVTGTANLLKSIETSLPILKQFVFISSVAVYGLAEGDFIPESHPLSAKDPYGMSKIEAESLVTRWCKENNVICTVLRLPLVVGKAPPGNLKKMINAIQNGYYFNIAGCNCKKSMVMGKDVAAIIKTAAATGGIFNLTDGYHPGIVEISSLVATQLDKHILNIPFWSAKIVARFGDLFGNRAPITTQKLIKLTRNLTFDDSKARKELFWQPTQVLENFQIK